MNSFKTKAGTELPLLNLKGKPYLQVAHRLVWFREEHPDWSIFTTLVSQNDSYCIAKATISDNKGNVIAMAHKREDQKHFADNIEKAESGAVGRALAFCGYGTQFAEELDESERIVDSLVVAKKTHSSQPVAMSEKIIAVMDAASKAGWDIGAHVKPYLKWKYGKLSSKDLSQQELEDLLNTVKTKTFAQATDDLRSVK